MLNSQTVKKMAKEFGADLVGISPLDRFEGAPKQNDPRYIFPQAKALIVLGYRIPRGTFRGIEEGTYFTSYPSMGYAGINWVYGPMVLWNLTRYIEDQGYEAVPVANINGGEAVNISSGKFKMNWSVPVSPEKPYPDVMINFRIAAFCAGLGEIGHSRIFLTPEFGPFQRFNIVLTDAPLDPDPLYSGQQLCDKCMSCVRNCPGALSKESTVKLEIAGRTVEFSELQHDKCLEGMRGNNGNNPFKQKYPSYYGYGCAIEAGKGCLRSCYAHLESKGVLKKKFHERFRKGKMWSVNLDEERPLSQHIIDDYISKGKIEEDKPVQKKDADSKNKKIHGNKIADPWS